MCAYLFSCRSGVSMYLSVLFICMCACVPVCMYAYNAWTSKCQLYTCMEVCIHTFINFGV